MKKKIFLVSILAAGMAVSAFAQPEYPTRPIEYVVGTGPGGGLDLNSRAIADYVSRKFGQPVMVVNKPGGGGVTGSVYALKQAKADGYTVMADTHTAAPMLVAGMANPPVKLEDRIFIVRLIVDPICYAVNAQSPWKTFKEFGQWVKANPEKLTWTSIGPAGLSAFGIQDWLAAIGADHTKTRMVPTEGAADSMTKLAGGHVVLSCHTVGECYTLHKAGKIRVLAVQSAKRSIYLPEVPTAEEEGVKGLSVRWWAGVSVRKGTPDFVVRKWEKVTEEMANDPEYKKKVEALHSDVQYLNSRDCTKFVYEEAKYYTELAKRIGLRK